MPFGLQDLLGSQNFGDNPSEMGQVVAPTLDMRMFYHPERRNIFCGIVSVTTGNNGLITSFAVPSNELWFVTAVGAIVNGAAVANQWFGHLSANIVNTQNSNFPGKTAPLAGMPFADQGAVNNVQPFTLNTDLDYLPILGSESIEFRLARSNVTAVNTLTFDCYVRYLKVRV